MKLDNLPINFFDFAAVGILVVGIFRGRKHGMSEELLMLLKWLTILFVCALAYDPVGKFFAQEAPVFDLLRCYLMAYVTVAILILALFAGIKRGLGGKLIGSDIFGSAEYYLGMGSGMIRFVCMMLVALALLNARSFTSAEVKSMEDFQNDVYGSNFFPTLHTVQSSVFEKSFIGSWIRQNLSFFLIKPTHPENKELKQKEYQLPQ